MSKTILMLCGFKGAGKDTIANFLNHYNYSKYAFATPVKDVISIMCGWDREMLEGTTEESREWRETVDEFWSERFNIPNFTPRKALTHISTEIIRKHLCDSIWIDSIINQLEVQDSDKIVITDLRFMTEYERIKEYCEERGYRLSIVKVNRIDPEYLAERYKAAHGDPEAIKIMNENDIHRSEYEWLAIEPDHIIDNSTTITNAYADAENKLKDFLS